MKVFDLKGMAAHPFEERERNVLYRSQDFSARIISLPPGGAIAPCGMESNVVFLVISGVATVEADEVETQLEEGHCLITEPATISMRSETGARILGLQIPRKFQS